MSKEKETYISQKDIWYLTIFCLIIFIIGYIMGAIIGF